MSAVKTKLDLAIALFLTLLALNKGIASALPVGLPYSTQIAGGESLESYLETAQHPVTVWANFVAGRRKFLASHISKEGVKTPFLVDSNSKNSVKANCRMLLSEFGAIGSVFRAKKIYLVASLELGQTSKSGDKNWGNYRVASKVRVSIPKIPGRIRTQGEYPSMRLSGGLFRYPLEAFAKLWNITLVPVPATGGGTGLKNKTTGEWNGVVGDVLNGKADVGIVTGITYQRKMAVDFSSTFEFQEMSFVIRNPKRIFTWRTIFWPFQESYWLSIGTSFLVVVIVLGKIPLDLESSKDIGISSSLMMTGRMILEQNSNLPLNSYIRAICILWLLLTLNICTMYKSRFFTILTIPLSENVPRTFEALAASNYRTGLHFLGGAASHLLRTSKNPSIVSIVNRGLENIPGKIRCYEKAASTPYYACIGWMGTIAPAISSNFSDHHGNSLLTISRTPAFVTNIAFSVKKGNPIQLPLNELCLRSNAAGLVGYWTKLDLDVLRAEASEWRKSLRAAGKKGALLEDSLALTVRHLLGVFWLWICGTVLSVCGAISELLVYTANRKSRQMQKKMNVSYTKSSKDILELLIQTARISLVAKLYPNVPSPDYFRG